MASILRDAAYWASYGWRRSTDHFFQLLPYVLPRSAPDLATDVNQYVKEATSFCKWPVYERLYQNDDLLEGSMKLRKRGFDLLNRISEAQEEEEDRNLAYRVDLASRKLLQFEKNLITNALAREKPLIHEGLRIDPRISLDDATLPEIEELVLDFETVAYVTRHLLFVPLRGYEDAQYHMPKFQPTRPSADSVSVSVKTRSIGYRLIQSLCPYADPNWNVRLEAALHCLVQNEKALMQQYPGCQPPMQTPIGEICAGESFELPNPEYRKLMASKEQAIEARKTETLDARPFLKRAVNPEGVFRFLAIAENVVE